MPSGVAQNLPVVYEDEGLVLVVDSTCSKSWCTEETSIPESWHVRAGVEYDIPILVLREPWNL